MYPLLLFLVVVLLLIMYLFIFISYKKNESKYARINNRF